MSGAPLVVHEPQCLTVAPEPARHPVTVYLAGLQSARSRTTMLANLERVAGVLGYDDIFRLPWHRLRYVELQALQARLCETLGPKGDPLSPSYINALLAAVRGVLKASWRLGLLSHEDYARATDFRPVSGSSLPAGRSLSAGEIQALVAACQADRSPAGPRDAVILGLGFSAGLRRAEIVALFLVDYDPESGVVEVRSGKGRKARRTFAPPGLQAALSDWLAARGEEPGPLLCPVDKAGAITLRRCRSQVVYAVAAKRARQAGVAPFSPHDMRRTFIGDLLDSGADISLVQQLAGHASVSTTQGYDRRPERARKTAAQALHFPWQPRQ